MNKICTTIEQSKKLLELGIDRKTSDMYYWCGSDLRIGGYRAQDEELDIPAWSLSALLELMPTKDYNVCWDLTFGSFDNDDNYIPKYNCSYIEADNVSTPMWFNEDCPLDAAFEMVVWLKENNKL